MADTKVSALTAASAAAAANELHINEAGTDKKLTVAQIAAYLIKRISGNSGAAGEFKTLQMLTSNSGDQTSTTPGVVMTTTGVGAGTWHYKYTVVYQTAATTTGIKLGVNHTGTVTTFQNVMWFMDSGAAASTGVGKGLTTAAVGSVPSMYSERVKDTYTFASVGVTDINANILAVVEGVLVVSVSGQLELKLGTEVAASAARLMAGSVLELTKIG